jgi:acetyl-CoA synthetase (ADP-forming)/acetyltransferase
LPRTQDPLVDQDEVYDAVFRRTGLLRVYDTAEWFDAAESLSRARPRRGGKLVILSNGQGPAVLAAAPTAAEGLLASFQDKTIVTLTKLLPIGIPVTNPLALGRDATAEHYANALAALHDDINVAAVLVIYALSPSSSSGAVAQVIAQTAKQSNLNVSACWFGAALDDSIRVALADANVALYEMPEKAARAFIHLDRDRRNQEALRQIPTSRRQQLVGAPAEPAMSGTTSVHALQLTDEKESTAFLTAYGRIWRAIKGRHALLEDEESIEILRAF